MAAPRTTPVGPARFNVARRPARRGRREATCFRAVPDASHPSRFNVARRPLREQLLSIKVIKVSPLAASMRPGADAGSNADLSGVDGIRLLGFNVARRGRRDVPTTRIVMPFPPFCNVARRAPGSDLAGDSRGRNPETGDGPCFNVAQHIRRECAPADRVSDVTCHLQCGSDASREQPRTRNAESRSQGCGNHSHHANACSVKSCMTVVDDVLTGMTLLSMRPDANAGGSTKLWPLASIAPLVIASMRPGANAGINPEQMPDNAIMQCPLQCGPAWAPGSDQQAIRVARTPKPVVYHASIVARSRSSFNASTWPGANAGINDQTSGFSLILIPALQ